MKKLYLFALAAIGTVSIANAQTPCDQGRFSTDLFATATVTSAINFGQNLTFTGATDMLDLDLYEPTGDTMSARPLIIWAHGGSFVGGTRTDSDVTQLSQAFAKKGFVCASIDYRVGMWPIDSVNSVKAVLRAVQDMKAAVRFFYKDRATANLYKIDTNNIFIGGSSAGAITSLHMAYLDKECEIEPYISIATLNAMGGIEGTSGNPGYSTNVVGVINLCGALASYGWMETGDVPFCSLHGNVDGTVPYNRGQAYVGGTPIMYLDGSRMIYEHGNNLGIQNSFYTHYGAGHAVYAGSAAYMDTTINFVGDFVVDLLGCTETPVQLANTPTGTSTFYTPFYCGLGVNSLADELIESVYPNPALNEMNVIFNSSEEINSVELRDLSGRLIENFNVSGNKLVIKKNNILSGTYILRITNVQGEATTRNVVFQ